MDTAASHKSQLLIDKLDAPSRKNILKLNKQLKEMKIEVESKIKNNVSCTNEKPEQYKENLSAVAKELASLDKEIHKIMNMVIEVSESAEPFFQGEIAQKINQVILKSMQEIKHLKKYL